VRPLFIALGVAALWIAVASPVADLHHRMLTAHMVQHLLIMILAAPLMMLGVRPLLARWRPFPVFCWLAGTATVMFWHVPPIFELAMSSHSWYEFQHASFFVAGILFWWPVIQPNPRVTLGWALPLYLFSATLPCDALSAFLAFCGHVVYRHYSYGGGQSRLSPLEDQALAGALMWVTVTFAYLIPALVVTAKLLSGERKQAVEIGAY